MCGCDPKNNYVCGSHQRHRKADLELAVSAVYYRTLTATRAGDGDKRA